MDTHMSPALSVPKSREEVQVLMRASVKRFRDLIPSLNAYARALTGNPAVHIEMDTRDNGSTDGFGIYMRPPLELGYTYAHDRRKCDKRDKLTLRQLCLACAQREHVLAILYHEIAHTAYGSFEKVTPAQLKTFVRAVVASHSPYNGDLILARIDAAPFGHRNSVMGLAGCVSAFFPFLLNAVEDMRVNQAMFKARLGTRAMLTAISWAAMNEGTEQVNARGEHVIQKWYDAPLNAQLAVGIYCASLGGLQEDWLRPEVITVLRDPEFARLIEDIGQSRSALGAAELSFKLLVRGRHFGFWLEPEEPMPPTAPPPADDKADESAPDDAADDTPESPEDGEHGPTGAEDDPRDDAGDADDDAGTDGPGSDGDDATTDEPEESDGPSADSADKGEGEDSGEETADQDLQEDGEGGDPTADDSSGDGDDKPGAGDADLGDPDSGGAGGTDSTDPEANGRGDDDSSPSDGSDSGDPRDGESGSGGESLDGDHADATGDGSSLSGSGDSGPAGHGPEADGTIDSGDEGDLSDEASETLEDSSDHAGTSDDKAREDDRDLESESSWDDDAGNSRSEEDVEWDRDEPLGDDDEGDGEGLLERDDSEESGFAEESGTHPDDQDEGAIEYASSSDDLRPEYGDVEDVQKAFDAFSGHDEKHERVEEKLEPYLKRILDEALKTHLEQGEDFDVPSANIAGIHLFDRMTKDTHRWTSSKKDKIAIRGRRDVTPLSVEEKILGPALLRMRVAFSNNATGGKTRNLRAGKVNSRVLGRRAWAGDDRLFSKQRAMEKRDYVVVLGLDVSGSTGMGALSIIKKAAYAQAELLSRMGIPFEIYAHSGEYDSNSADLGFNLVIVQVKTVDQPWNTEAKTRLASLGSMSANLDGHTLEFYRRRLDDTVRGKHTRGIMIYYTDGSMPLENYREELEILNREIATFKKKGYGALYVSVQNSDPQKYGLRTVRIDRQADVGKVVTELEDIILHL